MDGGARLNAGNARGEFTSFPVSFGDCAAATAGTG